MTVEHTMRLQATLKERFSERVFKKLVDRSTILI